MKTDFTKLEKFIQEKAKIYGANGAFLANYKGETVLQTVYGGETPEENAAPVTDKSRYLMPVNCKHMLQLMILMLLEEKKLRLGDKIAKFIPEFEHGDKISVKHLLMEKSGIRDFYYGEVIKQLNEDPEYAQKSETQRREHEMNMYLKHYGFSEVLKLIGGKPLEFVPGKSDMFSLSNLAFLEEIVERVSGMSTGEFAQKRIFEPLGMTNTVLGRQQSALPLYTLYRNKEYFKFDLEKGNFRFFTTDLGDMEKLLRGVAEYKLISKETFDEVTKTNSKDETTCFVDGFGTVQFYFDFENYETAVLYFDRANDLSYMMLRSYGSKEITLSDNEYRYFPREVRNEIDSLFVYPKDTKMEPYGRKNWYKVALIELEPEQREFVPGALNTVAMYAADGKKTKLFVETESGKAVGLLKLTLDPVQDWYDIDIVIIDRKFQGRGFGKIMLRFAVDYLKNHGAKKLTIGVSRFNIAARNLYKSVGFTENTVYEEFVEMTQKLD